MVIFFLSRLINRSVLVLIINCDEKIGALWHRIGNYQTDLFQFGMIDPCGNRDGIVVRAPLWPGFNSRTWRHTWVEFAVGFCPCSEGFFSGSFGSPFLHTNQHSKFQIGLETVNKKSRVV